MPVIMEQQELQDDKNLNSYEHEVHILNTNSIEKMAEDSQSDTSKEEEFKSPPES